MNAQELSVNSNSPTQAEITLAPWFVSLLQQNSINPCNENKLYTEKIEIVSSSTPATQKIYKVTPPILDEEYLVSKSKTHQATLPVQPFRDKEDIEKAKAYFHDTPSRYTNLNMRNYAIFVLALNTARRASDFSKIQFKDLINEDGTFKEHLIIEHEEKTNKKAVVLIHPNVKEAVSEYLNTLSGYSMSDYLCANYKTKEPLTTNGIWRFIKKMQKELDLKFNIGSHTPRKTFAYQAATNNPNDSATEIKTSKFLNHSNVETTHVYMGAGQDEMDEYVLNNGL